MPVDQIKSHYQRDGFYFPLNAFSHDEATQYGQRVKEISESDLASQLGNRNQINQLHVVCPFINDIIRSPVILDAVESILGPNILVWGTSVFLKPPHSPGFVSWHQDLTYWGLNNDQEVSAWIALSPVTRMNGCMRFIPQSHKLGQIPHRDITDETNILTRGQHVDMTVDESKAVYAELEPGQVSLHHGYLLHASGPNHSDQPRIGMVINYISTSVSQVASNLDFAMLVRGEDQFHHFEEIPVPENEFDQAGLATHHHILSTLNNVLYQGAENKDSANTEINR